MSNQTSPRANEGGNSSAALDFRALLTALLHAFINTAARLIHATFNLRFPLHTTTSNQTRPHVNEGGNSSAALDLGSFSNSAPPSSTADAPNRGGEIRNDEPQLSLGHSQDSDATGQGMPSNKNNSEEDVGDFVCPICLEYPGRKDVATISGCRHQFCFCCINRWSCTKNVCPLCKKAFWIISSDGVESEVNKDMLADILERLEESRQMLEAIGSRSASVRGVEPEVIEGTDGPSDGGVQAGAYVEILVTFHGILDREVAGMRQELEDLLARSMFAPVRGVGMEVNAGADSPSDGGD